MARLPKRLQPPLLDQLFALALVATVETEVASEHLHPYAASVPLLALFVGVLAWRRRMPFLAVLVGFAATLIAAAAGVSQHKPFSPILAIFIALYSLALYATPRRASVGLVYAIGCAYLQIAFAIHYGESYGGTDFGFIAVLMLAPWLVGKAMRGLQDAGRQALAEMARLLGMLRRDGEELGLAPQPGLDDLEGLVEQTRRAGLPVELRVEGTPRPMPLGAVLSAYRIVQDAVSNARKHAGEARATVTVRYGTEALEIEVADDGSGSGNGDGGGHGLVGMRERVALFGGELHAGPQAGGGFRVHARLPLAEPT